MTYDGRFKAAGHVRAVFDRSDGSGVLLDCRKGRWRYISPTMGYVWRQLPAEGSTLSELSGKVATRYGVPVEKVRADLEPVVSALLKERLLVASRRAWWRR